MIAHIFLKEKKPENLIAIVDIEVVPRGLYQIDNKVYRYTDQPKFIIRTEDRNNVFANLVRVEIIVEEYSEE